MIVKALIYIYMHLRPPLKIICSLYYAYMWPFSLPLGILSEQYLFDTIQHIQHYSIFQVLEKRFSPSRGIYYMNRIKRLSLLIFLFFFFIIFDVKAKRGQRTWYQVIDVPISDRYIRFKFKKRKKFIIF